MNSSDDRTGTVFEPRMWPPLVVVVALAMPWAIHYLCLRGCCWSAGTCAFFDGEVLTVSAVALAALIPPVAWESYRHWRATFSPWGIEQPKFPSRRRAMAGSEVDAATKWRGTIDLCGRDAEIAINPVFYRDELAVERFIEERLASIKSAPQLP